MYTVIFATSTTCQHCINMKSSMIEGLTLYNYILSKIESHQMVDNTIEYVQQEGGISDKIKSIIPAYPCIIKMMTHIYVNVDNIDIDTIKDNTSIFGMVYNKEIKMYRRIDANYKSIGEWIGPVKVDEPIIDYISPSRCNITRIHV